MVASSKIASLLLPSDITTHSKFKIPVLTIETSICSIDKEFELAELLKLANLLIWDGAPTTHKFCFEELDKSFKDIMSETKNASKKIFRRKIVVFGGDFKMILPVISRGSKVDIVHEE
ncbi:uncharacterized protein LOC131619337 [Vicia villosa]|uniref:uncharacterized protein LOC131619337 n=1 Tax=Vicia villosa TaxID=3911 RepID=UPI00273A87C5|nr:uncharacterized protein LOC131619337 [Vicia villosa]